MPAPPAAVSGRPRVWLDQAVCADPAHDPDWWWPAAAEPRPVDADWEHTARALQLCDRCPVRPECADDFYTAEQRGDPGGVRFATLPQHRRSPRAVRRRQTRQDQQESAA